VGLARASPFSRRPTHPEFKVETAGDAQIGHTGAGNVNLALRSGSNVLRGAASWTPR
jgi:hypothetical protein